MSTPKPYLLVADPDAFSDAADLSESYKGITLKAVAEQEWNIRFEQTGNQQFLGESFEKIESQENELAYTGTQVFGRSYSNRSQNNKRFIIEFEKPTDFFSVDIVGCYAMTDPDGYVIGKMESIDKLGNNIDEVSSKRLKHGETAVLTCKRMQADIKFMTLFGAEGYGNEDYSILIDNFRYHFTPVLSAPENLRFQ